jgi:type II secretory pathway pseudopilin PulG
VRRYPDKAFTILELLVAMALLVAMLAISGLVFKMAVDAHRRAEATAEVTRKLRAIVNQLDADFKGLRTDCDIFLGWVPVPVDGNGRILPSNTPPANVHHYARFDKILFYTNGNFQTYLPWPYADPTHTPPAWTDYVTGNIARVCYSHAEDPAATANNDPLQLPLVPARRILARSQHIYAPDARLSPVLDWTTSATLLNTFTFGQTGYTNVAQYDAIDPRLWTSLPRPGMVPPDPANLKLALLARIFGYTLLPLNLQAADRDFPFLTHGGAFSAPAGGLIVDPMVRPVINPHLIFGERVGEFKIQCWYDAPLGYQSGRWYPEVDPNGDGNLADSDFARLLPNSLGNGMLAALYSGGGNWQSPPGPGRALKFTFTLYDSHGVFKNGKTFTHIVYLK